MHDINEDWDFLVLACDGIWDVLTNQVNSPLSLQHDMIYENDNDFFYFAQAVVNFVTEMIGEGKYPESICEELLTYCLAPVIKKIFRKYFQIKIIKNLNLYF